MYKLYAIQQNAFVAILDDLYLFNCIKLYIYIYIDLDILFNISNNIGDRVQKCKDKTFV